MMTLKWTFMWLVLAILCVAPLNAQKRNSYSDDSNKKTDFTNRLIIVWTSGDKEVAKNMVFMYAYNYKEPTRWQDITIIVWGPSAKLLAEDQELQLKLAAMMKKGIIVKACMSCADQYGVSGKLRELGVKVKYMGQELTDYIKKRYHIITF